MTKTIALSFLTALGGPKQAGDRGSGPFVCPLHNSQSPTLLLLPGGDFGHYFRCVHSECKFGVGGPVALLRAVRNLSVADAMTAFLPGGEFAEVFREGLPPQVYNQYVVNHQAQDVAARYVKDCHDRLKTAGSFLLNHLDTLRIRRDQVVNTNCGKAIMQGALPALLPFLKTRLSLSYALAGAILMAATFASSIMQPVFGYFSDKREKVLLLPLGCLAAGVGLSLLSTPNRYGFVLMLVMISGLGVAAYHPEGYKTAHYFTGKNLATGMSVL